MGPAVLSARDKATNAEALQKTKPPDRKTRKKPEKTRRKRPGSMPIGFSKPSRHDPPPRLAKEEPALRNLERPVDDAYIRRIGEMNLAELRRAEAVAARNVEAATKRYEDLHLEYQASSTPDSAEGQARPAAARAADEKLRKHVRLHQYLQESIASKEAETRKDKPIIKPNLSFEPVDSKPKPLAKGPPPRQPSLAVNQKTPRDKVSGLQEEYATQFAWVDAMTRQSLENEIARLEQEVPELDACCERWWKLHDVMVKSFVSASQPSVQELQASLQASLEAEGWKAHLKRDEAIVLLKFASGRLVEKKCEEELNH